MSPWWINSLIRLQFGVDQYFHAFDLTFRPSNRTELVIFTSARGLLMLQSNCLNFRAFETQSLCWRRDNLLNGASVCLSSASMYNDLKVVCCRDNTEWETAHLLTPSVPHLSIMAGWNSHRTLMKASRLFKSLLVAVGPPPSVDFSIDPRHKDMSTCSAQST